jgi:hypothetical protein
MLGLPFVLFCAVLDSGLEIKKPPSLAVCLDVAGTFYCAYPPLLHRQGLEWLK